MVTQALDYNYILFENYKKMKISETELATILMIEHLIADGNSFITADLLSLKMSMRTKEIDKVLATLVERGFLDIVTEGKKTKTSLEPLYKKLVHQYTVTSANEEAMEKSKKATEELENVYEQFEKLLKRTLAPVEVNKIGEWISLGYSDETIINALKEALSNGKKTIRSVDKILLAWASRDDIEVEGHTTISDEWDRNLEETIRIAKTPWLTNDDDDK